MTDPRIVTSAHLFDIGECRPAFFNQQSDVPSFGFRRLRISPVLRHGPPNSLDTTCGSRPGTESPVKPATAIRHRSALAGRAAPRLRPATRRLREISRRVPILEPTVPRFMGCLFGFVHLTPSPPVVLAGADGANNRLPALVYMDMLHRHPLL